MTDAEALDWILVHRNARRLHELATQDARYLPIVRALAEGRRLEPTALLATGDPKPTPAAAVEPLSGLYREALRCPFRGRPIEGCGCFRCLAGGGEPDTARVDVTTCVLCQRVRLRALPDLR
jgi:hypothetical protein